MRPALFNIFDVWMSVAVLDDEGKEIIRYIGLRAGRFSVHRSLERHPKSIRWLVLSAYIIAIRSPTTV